MPEISVIVPVYNADRDYLKKSIESALGQTYSDIEVIVVNDGSSNGCEKVLDPLLSDRRLKLINKENGGTSTARNAGLDAAVGTYVLFLDADDHLEKDCCERLIQEVRKDESPDILFFGYATEYTNRQVRRVLDKNSLEKGQWEGLWQRDALELAILRGDRRLGPVEIGAPWGKLIKRSAIEAHKVRYTPGLIKGQDTVFILNLIEKCESFKYLPYLGYYYRISDSSVSHRFNPDIVEIMERTLGAYSDFVSANRKGAEFEKAVRGKYYRVLTGEYLELYFVNRNNPAKPEEKRRQFASLLKRREYREAIAAEDGSSAGIFQRLMRSALLKNNIGAAFALKRAELFAKRLVVRQYA